MAETPKPKKSQFIATFRLKPERSFTSLQAKFTTKDGYEFSFRGDMVWIRFDATSDEWQRQLGIVRQVLRTLLSILTIQTEYSFDLEPIQWIEDKPRDESDIPNYVLGRLGPDLAVQIDPPSITVEHIGKSEIYAHLASINPYYRYALLDYSVALSFIREAIVFCARSTEWVESYFKIINQFLPKATKVGARNLMRDKLKLPNKYLNQFFKIANETVIARHAGATRSPTVEEIRFCVILNRIVLDRFGGYIWYSQSKKLPVRWAYPKNEKPLSDQFEDKNPGLTQNLEQILTGQLS